VDMYHITYLPTDRQWLLAIDDLAIVHRAVINMGLQVSLQCIGSISTFLIPLHLGFTCQWKGRDYLRVVTFSNWCKNHTSDSAQGISAQPTLVADSVNTEPPSTLGCEPLGLKK
jgi:hypothetical protein